MSDRLNCLIAISLLYHICNSLGFESRNLWHAWESCLYEKDWWHFFAIFLHNIQGNLDLKTAPWPTISEAAKDCVRKLLTRDPSRRPSAREVLQVDFLLALCTYFAYRDLCFNLFPGHSSSTWAVSWLQYWLIDKCMIMIWQAKQRYHLLLSNMDISEESDFVLL